MKVSHKKLWKLLIMEFAPEDKKGGTTYDAGRENQKFQRA